MGIDTRGKRFSMISRLKMWKPAMVSPDGTIDQSDRQHFLRGYPGILWLPLVIANGIVRIVGVAKSLTVSGEAKSLKVIGIDVSLKIRGSASE